MLRPYKLKICGFISKDLPQSHEVHKGKADFSHFNDILLNSENKLPCLRHRFRGLNAMSLLKKMPHQKAVPPSNASPPESDETRLKKLVTRRLLEDLDPADTPTREKIRAAMARLMDEIIAEEKLCRSNRSRLYWKKWHRCGHCTIFLAV